MLQPGDRFERYTIEAELGRGGMGTVYLAHDERLQRHIALKVVHRSANAQEASARLLREARAAAALIHPNIITIYDVGEADDATYIAMEFIAGRTLRGCMKGSPSLLERASWLRDVACALSAAHQSGIIHRDIKPENVLIADKGVVKVVDFGIARRTSGNDTVTKEDVIIGTPPYMAPEQLESGPFDGRTDQFAWGVVAHEVLTGRPPWGGASGTALLLAILNREPEPIPDNVPSALAAIVLRALSKDPEKRFTSMDEVVRALDVSSAVMEVASGSKVRTPSENEGMTFLEVSETHCFAAYRNVLFCLWGRTTTLGEVEDAHRLFGAYAEKFNTKVSFLFWIPKDAVPLDTDARAAVSAMAKKLSPFFSRVALVYDGRGFQAAMVRAVVTGIMSFARYPFQHDIFNSADAASLWLVDGLPPVGGTTITANELRDHFFKARDEFNRRRLR